MVCSAGEDRAAAERRFIEGFPWCRPLDAQSARPAKFPPLRQARDLGLRDAHDRRSEAAIRATAARVLETEGQAVDGHGRGPRPRISPCGGGVPRDEGRVILVGDWQSGISRGKISFDLRFAGTPSAFVIPRGEPRRSGHGDARANLTILISKLRRKTAGLKDICHVARFVYSDWWRSRGDPTRADAAADYRPRSCRPRPRPALIGMGRPPSTTLRWPLPTRWPSHDGAARSAGSFAPFTLAASWVRKLSKVAQPVCTDPAALAVVEARTRCPTM